jgi:hypothetical protein
MLKNGLAGASCMNENSLSDVPAEEFAWWALRIIGRSPARLLFRIVTTVRANMDSLYGRPEIVGSRFIFKVIRHMRLG